jgi:hypothetical protein
MKWRRGLCGFYGPKATADLGGARVPFTNVSVAGLADVDEYLITHAQPCKALWPQRDYSFLHPVISTLANRALWLEHEALVMDHRFEAELESLIQH